MCTKNLFALSSNPYYLPRIVRGIADYCVGVEVEKEAFDAKYFDMGLDWTGLEGLLGGFPPFRCYSRISPVSQKSPMLLFLKQLTATPF